jgi:hypothetical protein
MYFFLKVPWSGRPLKRGLASGVDTGGTGSRGQQRVGHGDRASMYVACDPSHRECSTVIIVISRVLGQEMVSETLFIKYKIKKPPKYSATCHEKTVLWRCNY